MKIKSSNIKNFIQWLLAIVVAFALANILILPYWYTPGWVSRDQGATPAIYHANQMVINGYEGYGYANVDQRGYLNEDKPLADEVVLVLGCSHTKGIEVPMGQRYTDILNDKLSGGDDSKLYVYNMAIDGFYLPQIVEGFQAALQEIPSAKTVIIEMPTTDFAPTDFSGNYYDRSYSANQTGTTAFLNIPFLSKLKVAIKEFFPLASLYLSKQLVFEGSTKTPFLYHPPHAETMDYPPNVTDAYTEAVKQAFKTMRECWDGEIYIMYHPEVELQNNGNLSVIPSYTLPWFINACDAYDINILGSGGDWSALYQNSNTVPYGFSNTAPCVGHLNADGHRVIADILYKFLEGGNN